MTLNRKRKVLIWLVAVVLMLAFTAGCTSPPSTDDTSGNAAGDNDPKPPGNASVEEPQDSDAVRLLIDQIMQSAKEGKVPGCEFAARTTVIDDVEEKWGEPDKVDYVAAAKGQYATFAVRGIVFGFNKGSQVFDVRSYDSALQEITLSRIKDVLGTPDMTRNYAGEDIIGYETGTEFRLKFIFPQATEQNPDPRLDHISVLYPRGTVNMMADDPGLEW